MVLAFRFFFSLFIPPLCVLHVEERWHLVVQKGQKLCLTLNWKTHRFNSLFKLHSNNVLWLILCASNAEVCLYLWTGCVCLFSLVIRFFFYIEKEYRLKNLSIHLLFFVMEMKNFHANSFALTRCGVEN